MIRYVLVEVSTEESVAKRSRSVAETLDRR